MKVNVKQVMIYPVILLSGGIIGYLINTSDQTISSSDHQHIELATDQTWTCSMHPQIRQPEPGQCPIGGMDLVLTDPDDSGDNLLGLRMSPTAMQLANVRTSIIALRKPMKEVRLIGKVQADERSIFSQTSHISGRIEKLLVNYTGGYISKGQIIAFVYSPELVTAQEELFVAQKMSATQPELFKAARDKLKNWKLTDKQIDGILQSGSPAEEFPILSDMNGVVMTKRVNLGDHINQGSSLFEVANLSNIWILFDVYESDIAWVKKGDEVEFSIQSLPGEKFKGKISFIDPVINPKTRVAKARIALKNPGHQLKPEMFASGILKSPLKKSELSIIVPKSAIMWTGRRSVVYIKRESNTGINFILREVTLGPALGDSYMITDGLEEGDEIATNGTFSIDAAAQLAGKPSMMNPEGGKQTLGGHAGMDMGEDKSMDMELKIEKEDE